MGTGSLSLE